MNKIRQKIGLAAVLFIITLVIPGCDLLDSNEDIDSEPDPHGMIITVNVPEGLAGLQGDVGVLTIEDNITAEKITVELRKEKYGEADYNQEISLNSSDFGGEYDITLSDVDAGEYYVKAELYGSLTRDDNNGDTKVLYEGFYKGNNNDEAAKVSVKPDSIVDDINVKVIPLDAESLEVTIDDPGNAGIMDKLEKATLKHPSEEEDTGDWNDGESIIFDREDGYKPSRWHLELEFQDYEWAAPIEVLLLPTEARLVTIGIETDYIEAKDVTVTAGDTGRINVVAYDRNDNPVPGETIKIDSISEENNCLDGIDVGDTDVTNLEGVARFDFTAPEVTEETNYDVSFSVKDETITDTATVTVEAVDVGEEGEITDWDDLNDIRNDLDGDYELNNDLDEDTGGYDDYAGEDANNDKGWEPIGNADERFTGTFDGNDYKIKDLYINRPDEDNVGLFGHVGDDEDATTIKNVCVKGADVTGGRGTGVLIGRVTGNRNTLIEKVCATGEVKGTGATGGLIGSFNSYRTTSGGTDNPVLRHSFADVEVKDLDGQNGDFDKFGGLVGCGQKGTIIDSYARGDVTVDSEDGERIGGLAGCIDMRGILENTYSTGKVDAEESDSVGGLVGNVEGRGGNAGEIIDSMSLESVEHENVNYDVIGDEGMAELTGRVTDAPDVDMKGEGLYTEEEFNDYDDMDDPWNENIWHIEENDNEYPTLEWQND